MVELVVELAKVPDVYASEGCGGHHEDNADGPADPVRKSREIRAEAEDAQHQGGEHHKAPHPGIEAQSGEQGSHDIAHARSIGHLLMEQQDQRSPYRTEHADAQEPELGVLLDLFQKSDPARAGHSPSCQAITASARRSRIPSWSIPERLGTRNEWSA